MSIEARLGTVVVVLPSATRPGVPTNFKLKSPNGGGSWHSVAFGTGRKSFQVELEVTASSLNRQFADARKSQPRGRRRHLPLIRATQRRVEHVASSLYTKLQLCDKTSSRPGNLSPGRRHGARAARGTRPQRFPPPVPGPRFPVPADSESGSGEFPDSRFRPSREAGIPSPFPGQIGNRGNGNLNCGPGLPGLRLVVILHRPGPVLGSLRRKTVGGRNLLLNLHLKDPGLKATNIQPGPARGPGSCLLYSHPRPGRGHGTSIPDFPTRICGKSGNGRFPDSRSRPNRESGERELGISGSESVQTKGTGCWREHQFAVRPS
jgi:hypothetical protein